MNAFRVIGYDLGIPLSYRFLRRYARVSINALNLLRKSFKYWDFEDICEYEHY